MLLRVQHETKLSYSEPVSETVFDVRMAPPSDEDQTNLGYRLRIAPLAPVTIYRDGFGNRVDLFNILTPYSELVIRATSIVRTHRGSAPESRLNRLVWDPKPLDQMALEALEYLEPSPLAATCPEVDQFIRALKKPEGRLSDVIHELMGAVKSALIYEKKVTSARTPVGEALRLGRGVCQDYAHLFLAACRGIGLPARYVSGYIHEPGEVATHAWCQVWTGSSGWLDVDPTRGTLAGDDYIKIAIGRDYSDVPPNRGVWKGRAEETIAVSVKVEPIERVPPDWSEWSGVQVPWSASSWVQSQSRLERARLHPHVGYRQQQGQQQQLTIAQSVARGSSGTPPAHDHPEVEWDRAALP
jgi:transglutaminase-like putative cysteine protease